jgi:hypothetical protein
MGNYEIYGKFALNALNFVEKISGAAEYLPDVCEIALFCITYFHQFYAHRSSLESFLRTNCQTKKIIGTAVSPSPLSYACMLVYVAIHGNIAIFCRSHGRERHIGIREEKCQGGQK